MTWIWLLAAVGAGGGARLLGRFVLEWSRARSLGVTNYRGLWVPWGLGIAWALSVGAATGGVAALALGLAAGRGQAAGPALPAEGGSLASLTAWILWAALVGAVDDLLGDRDRRGLAGHGRALAEGRLTTGALKLLLLGGGAVAAAATARPSAPLDGATLLLGGGVIALTVNGVNLLDVRPGRALKGGLILLMAALAADPLGSLPALPGLGAALGVLHRDLGEEGVLGDAGANALGALAGWALWRALPAGALLLFLAALAALHLYAEKHSLSEQIDGSPFLRWLDRLGRRVPIPKGEEGGASN